MNEPFRMFPEAASRSATVVDYLSLTLLGIGTLFSVGIALAIVFFIVRYWHTRNVNRESSHSKLLHWTIELVWSIGPFLILMGLFAWGTVVYVNEHRPPNDSIEIYVVAKQWMWKVTHQNGRREINSLHVPIGRPVRLTMISEDVIHSFYVPAFRTKRDVLPGRYSTLWFEPTKTGIYHLFCAEYCGTDHSKMIGEVIVQTPEEYALWLADEHTDSLAERGRRQFATHGCLQCHGRFEGVQLGPPLTGLYGRRVALADGAFALADDAYIRRAILNPAAQVHVGFTVAMPSYEGKLEPEHVMELIAYLRSIADATGPLAGPGIESPDSATKKIDLP
jgi:cytochrome c oxidase subunit 2